MAQLTIQDLCFSYGERPILSALSVEFPSRQLLGIVGPNGCGKSTLVSLLANLIKPSRGSIRLDGQSIAGLPRRELARKVAYLPQAPICPAGITVSQVLRYGRQPYQSLFRQFSREDAAKIAEIASMLQLGPIMEKPMEHLSGGQRQKAWLGMVLVQDTDVVLLDEPTSALDIGHQHEVLECIRAVCDLGKTVVMVIHDLGAAARFCDQLLAMKDGALYRFGPPREVVNEELILSLYGIHVEILAAGVGGSPVIVPVRLKAGATAP